MNKAYFITYDLKKSDEYSELIEKIKSLAINKEMYVSVWESSHLIRSNLNQNDIVANLRPLIKNGSKLIVFEVGKARQGLLLKKEWKKVKKIID